MKWEKRGRIFVPANNYPWMRHHASLPIPDPVNEKIIRVYFSSRDDQEQSYVSFFEVKADNPAEILYVHDRPVLSPGKLGTFDDSGTMASCLINEGSRKWLYYIGWNRGVTVPYRNAVGLAVSEDGGFTFNRVFEGPVVDRTAQEPYFIAAPFVLKEDNLWRMWYPSSTGWLMINGRPEPVYQVKYAESSDGQHWRRPNLTCLEYRFQGEALGRPCVLKEDGIYKMWYCWRGSINYRTDKAQSYRLGYAESRDGVHWERKDEEVGIDRSETGWDSEMIEYPFVFDHGGRRYLFYNGNGFGRTGIGYAVLVEK